jgi:hypothetical protein
MKNFKLSIVLFSLFLLSCSSDDDSSNCYQCNVNLSGQLSSTNILYCDNGDGTMEVTVDGRTKTISLEGVTFENFIIEARLIGSCTPQ